MDTKKILIVGVGQVGSRHLQALKKVSIPLKIILVDPSIQALKIAKRNYEEAPEGIFTHSLTHTQTLPKEETFEIAIIATTSNIRAKIIKDLLVKNRVSYFILEKLLFDKKSSYAEINKIFSKTKIKAWVNCPRRAWPIYKQIKNGVNSLPISLTASMGQWDLACNAIHFIDLIAYLTGDSNLKINTDHLERKVFPVKRPGFLEIRGTLRADFNNKSTCQLTSYISGNAPFLLEISNSQTRYIIKEWENKALFSGLKNKWKWEEINFKTPPISDTTTEVVKNILTKGNCPLTPFDESSKLHTQTLEPLKQFLNKYTGKKYEKYPFT